MGKKIDRDTVIAETLAVIEAALHAERLTSTSGTIPASTIAAVMSVIGAAVPHDVRALAIARTRLARARAASAPVFTHVGELPRERRARQRAEAERMIRFVAEVEADPVEGSWAAPIDMTSDSAIERHDRAARARGVERDKDGHVIKRSMHTELAVREARAEARPRAFSAIDLTTHGRAA
jgi:hypothetical protein